MRDGQRPPDDSITVTQAVIDHLDQLRRSIDASVEHSHQCLEASRKAVVETLKRVRRADGRDP